jgi:hypothetical protein
LVIGVVRVAIVAVMAIAKVPVTVVIISVSVIIELNFQRRCPTSRFGVKVGVRLFIGFRSGYNRYLLPPAVNLGVAGMLVVFNPDLMIPR